jgi:hypothetical protein
MKKRRAPISWSILTIIFFQFPFLGGFVNHQVPYTVEDSLNLELNQPVARILQFTDLHLTFGVDAYDQQTFSMIRTITEAEQPDLVVFTGDQTMSPLSPWLFGMLSDVMETLHIPWTFIFGNHDDDFNDNRANLMFLNHNDFLYFLPGPDLLEGGLGNFKINLNVQGNAFYHLYFLDSKAELDSQLFAYDYLSEAQVNWFNNHVMNDTHHSLAFMHIPLQEMGEFEGIPFEDGSMGETEVYDQHVNTGFFDTAVNHGKTKGIFFGHDHLSNFSFYKEGILLAYGQTSGYNGYGQNARGARLITVTSSSLTSELLFHEEYR